MTEGDRDRARGYMGRARRALEAAEHNLDGGFVDEAISRCYYAALYAAKALLATRGFDTNRHSAAIQLLGREFITSGLLPGQQGRVLGLLLQHRLNADYEVAPDFTPAAAREHLHEATEFVADARALLDDLLGSG